MSLTPQQEKVLGLLSSGSTTTYAAGIEGIHRNTIQNWLRSDPEFQHALAHARQAKTLHWQGQAELLAADALETIRSLMTNPKTPPATRLRAAQIILSLATNPPMKLLKSVHKSALASAVAGDEPQSDDEEGSACDPASGPEPEKVLNSAQSLPEGAAAVFGCDLPDSDPEKVHNSAQPQQPHRRPAPKIGRNELCPCGSGRKFKRCCVDKLGAVPPYALEAA